MLLVILLVPIAIALVIGIPENNTSKKNPYDYFTKEQAVLKQRDFSEYGQKLWRFIILLTKNFRHLSIPISDKKRKRLEKTITYAGMQKYLYVEDVINAKVLFSVLFFAYFIFLFLISQDMMNFYLGIAATVLGTFLPETLVSIQARKRQDSISRELPGILSSLAIVTDAGLNIIPAIETVVAQNGNESELAKEFSKVLEEVKIGRGINDALYAMSIRVEAIEVRNFISALNQGIEKGNAGITDIIRKQADESWKKRKMKAKAMADKASIKLFLPLLGLVFPAFAIFLVGPMIFTLVDLFKLF